MPQAIEVTQGALKGLEAWRRAQGMEPIRLLDQIGPDTGRLLAILLAGAPAGEAVEIGTGAGYSGLWLALACRATGRRLRTFELDPAKAELARQSFFAAAVQDVVDFVQGDGLAGLSATKALAFCFVDAGCGLARGAYGLALPRLAQGGLLCVHKALSHAAGFQDFLDDATSDPRVDAVIVPIGAGLLICRKV